MKNLFKLIFASFLPLTLSQMAFSTTVVPVEIQTCTRDFNLWGHANHCACPEATRYETRIGQCVQGAPVAATEVGMITDEMAIGGETTGIVLKPNANESIELILNRVAASQIEELKTQGLNYRVEGEWLNVEGVETGIRPTIIVDKIVPVTADEVPAN